MGALYENLTVGEVYTTGQVLNIMKSVPEDLRCCWFGHVKNAERDYFQGKQVLSKRAIKKCRVVNWQSRITGEDALCFERTKDGKWELDEYALCLFDLE